MPSFISNFKQRLRLPRMFFRRPTREEQIHGGPPLEIGRPLPPIQWRGITAVVTIVVIAAGGLLGGDETSPGGLSPVYRKEEPLGEWRGERRTGGDTAL